VSDSTALTVQEPVIATSPLESASKEQVIAPVEPQKASDSCVVCVRNLNTRMPLALYERFHEARKRLRIKSNADMIEQLLDVLEHKPQPRIRKVCPSMDWSKVGQEWFPAFSCSTLPKKKNAV
jgi:hypothetical protein